ncbi:GntR family transcriptional regulator [Methylobacterium longum]|uniref:GntR family transcriptional regulator n=1 Tax=Methylobacterium longum TaxID=767694 RepID=A0ABT8AR23_9HYPH|nr:GntR family transcriptional regulator [Methylobacterium longum]MDN3572349.1 GntR family transcriptional regulator [Methylobacterium longum]GJE09507.1 HTH-type transcriptional repressor RspR [Methylobacterium longum]
MARARPKGRPDVEDGERKTSLVDDAYAAMRAAIRDASFAPGYQASEQEIALRLGMSRTPVHEAAIRLQEDGLVRVLPRKGILILALAPDDVREIYDVIIAIEGRAAELVAALPDAERLAAAQVLDTHTDAMADAHKKGDLPGWGEADGAFHAALIEHARNGRMSRIIQAVNDQSHRARMLTLNLRRGLEASIAEHRKIVQAVRAGKAADALEAARAHRIRARDELLPILKSYGLKHL